MAGMADQPAPRRRFQFSLRTLMIGVTLLAAACGYVAWQAKIVQERKAVADLVQYRYNGAVYWSSEVKRLSPTASGLRILQDGIVLPLREVSWLRRWLGDDAATYILYRMQMPKDEITRMKAAFPEAHFESDEYVPTTVSIEQADSSSTQP
jgi:hypothetical protein